MKNIILILFTFLTSFLIMGQEMYVDIETTNSSPGIGEKFKISYILKVKIKMDPLVFHQEGLGLQNQTLLKGLLFFKKVQKELALVLEI